MTLAARASCSARSARSWFCRFARSACHFLSASVPQKSSVLASGVQRRTSFPFAITGSWARRWGPGERIVFEPYTAEAFAQSRDWIAERKIFEGGKLRANGAHGSPAGIASLEAQHDVAAQLP